jgi:hypothetical protein
MYHIGNYGIKHYYADTYADVANIPLEDAATGSTVFVIDTSTNYMLNSEKRWISVNLGSSGGGGSTGGNIIYEGGGV